MNRISSLCVIAAALSGVRTEANATGQGPNFRKRQLTDHFYCEGVHDSDFNQDGHMWFQACLRNKLR